MVKKKFVDNKSILKEHIKKYNFYIPYNDFYKLKYKKIKTNSWYKSKKANLKNNMNKFVFNNDEINDKVIKCKKIILLPTEKQKEILLLWLEYYRKMYNETIKVIYKLMKDNNKNMFSFRYIRTYLMKNVKQKFVLKSKIYSHILDGAIKLACVSFKSAESNLKNRHITHYRIRPIKQSKKSKVLDLEKTFFSKEGFCIKMFGPMKNNDNFNYKDINCDSKLHYNQMTDRFTLLVSYEYICKEKTNDNSFISIDPGIKTFLTGLTNDSIYNLGTNVVEVIKKELTEIDRFSKINNKISRKIIKRKKIKLYNKITDLHWKSIDYILNKKQIKNVFIGNWSTKRTSSRKSKLHPMYKRISLKLQYYGFLQKLENKCKEYNVNYKLTNESYTSKVCSFCSMETTINNDRLLNCGCGLRLDRDINGSINILLKNL
jgi:putative transposase